MTITISSMDTAKLAWELRALKGAWVDKIYQTGKSDFIFRINIPETGKREFVISLGRYIRVSKEKTETPSTPSQYSMLLRKHLGGGRIGGVRQYDFDRVLEIDVDAKGERLTLIIEMFKDGNILLVKGGVIVHPFRSVDVRHRRLAVGEKYAYPPKRANPLLMSKDDFDAILKGSSRDAVRALAVDVNLGGLYSEEALLGAGIDKSVMAKDLDDLELSKLYERISKYKERVASPGAYVIKSEGDVVAISAFEIEYGQKGGAGKIEKIRFDTISDCIAFALKSGGIKEVRRDRAKEDYTAERERLLRQLAQQKEVVAKGDEEISRYRWFGDFVYANISKIEEGLEKIKEIKKDYAPQEIIGLIGHLIEYSPMDDVALFRFGNDEIEIALSLTANENAQKYYNRSKRERQRLEGARSAVAETTQKLEELGRKRQAQEIKKSNAPRKPHWFEQYRWLVTSQGTLCVAGRDAKSNDKIVKRYLKKQDRYAHADIAGAPSVVLKCKGEPDNNALREACQESLIFSKAWGMGLASGSSFWVMPDQVSKRAGSGEFVATGSWIIRGKKNRFENIDIKAAIGEVEYEKTKMLMCGPQTAVSKHTKRYIVVSPESRMDERQRSDAIKEVAMIFSAPLGEVARIVPPGGFRIENSQGIPTGNPAAKL